MSHPVFRAPFLAALALLALPVLAQVRATDAWVRGMVPGQDTTAAYMRLEAQTDTTLVGVSSPVAKHVALHEMAMEGGVMRMRAVSRLKIPAGKSVTMGPDGYHVMLVDVAHPLREGETVPVELEFEDEAGKRTRIVVRAPVKPLTAPAQPAPHQH